MTLGKKCDWLQIKIEFKFEKNQLPKNKLKWIDALFWFLFPFYVQRIWSRSTYWTILSFTAWNIVLSPITQLGKTTKIIIISYIDSYVHNRCYTLHLTNRYAFVFNNCSALRFKFLRLLRFLIHESSDMSYKCWSVNRIKHCKHLTLSGEFVFFWLQTHWTLDFKPHEASHLTHKKIKATKSLASQQ